MHTHQELSTGRAVCAGVDPKEEFIVINYGMNLCSIVLVVTLLMSIR